MRIISEEQLDYQDLMLSPQRSNINSRSEVNLFRTFYWEGSDGRINSLKCIPVMVANMVGIACPAMAKVVVREGMCIAMEKHCTFEELNQLYNDVWQFALEDGVPTAEYTNRIFLTIGIKESWDVIEQVDKAWKIGGICIDIPNGYISALETKIKEAREKFPNALIIAGNVVTGDRTYDILNSGANAAKIGIGPGSACMTRKVTGVGRPQASAVIDCANSAHNVKGYIVADGGCQTEGHIAIAFGLGADFVMVGGLFSGCDECEGEIVERDGKKYKMFMGSSSQLAQNMKFGGMSKYRSSEGREVLVPLRGTVIDVINNIKGGLRSAGTYIGASEIKHFSKCANFYKVNRVLNTMFANNQQV